MASDDGGDRWYCGDVTNIEGEYITVGFYNPNTGDAWISIYDANDENVEITVVEKRE